MATTGPRMALAALAALGATAVFTAPANAAPYGNDIYVSSEAHIAPDGTIHLSGEYHCTAPSPSGAVQIKATIEQEDVRLSIGGGDARCDGEVHDWSAHGTLRLTPTVHAGEALAKAELQEIRFGGGLLPRSIDTVAQDARPVRVIDHR
ncbi:DUF6299 family protein [Streptomyces sp. NBC_00335]|uniref:DUF6299 family protein n=1 Tax=unclassified Streptomyces TaxID=2593676 RepID=UPI00225A9615|nr:MULTISPECIES: DUF6299 family protein [unclassified Streptomyces]MCX5406693.1 DUF6299 family protein [Streptomyces sp. NBC_00086]